VKWQLVVVTLIFLLGILISPLAASEIDLINKAIELVYDLSQAPDRAPFLELLNGQKG